MDSKFPLSPLILEPLIDSWLREDMGRGDRTTECLAMRNHKNYTATWIAKETGVIAGLPIAAQVFSRLDSQVQFQALKSEGEIVQVGEKIAHIQGCLAALLTGERVALNLAMSLSGIATLTRTYVDKIADLPTRLVDTRKTTPGLRIVEKYATKVGGAINHRFGLDDAIMLKDNHIAASQGISRAVAQVRANMPYPLSIEVETSNLEEVQEALAAQVDTIMLDNMTVEQMRLAVQKIRQYNPLTKIEASGNITLERIRQVAETGVDYISTSAPITRSCWLDLSMRLNFET